MYTHEQMGTIERRHLHVVEMGLSPLSHSNLLKVYWEDAFQTATYIINRLLTSILNNKSPYKVVFKRKPFYSFMKVLIVYDGHTCAHTINTKLIFDRKYALYWL